MPAYPNPLHDEKLHYSQYSALVAANVDSRKCGLRSRVPWQIVPQKYNRSCKWANATMHNTYPRVSFGQYGIRLTDAISPRVNVIEAANTTPMTRVMAQTIQLHITWSGYERRVQWQRPIQINGAKGPVTKAQLVSSIARMLTQYLEKCSYDRSEDPLWAIGGQAYHPDHVILLALTNPVENAWQVEVAVHRPI